MVFWRGTMSMWSLGRMRCTRDVKLTRTRQPIVSQFKPTPPNSRGLVRALVTIGDGCTNRKNPGIHERKDEVSWCYLSHEFVEGVLGSIRVALWGPEISALNLMPECLVLIHPPIAHVLGSWILGVAVDLSQAKPIQTFTARPSAANIPGNVQQ